MAVPPVAYTASRTRKSPSGLGTVTPKATVFASGHSLASRAPPEKAATIGAQPAAWTATSRGKAPSIQASSRSSRSAL